VADSPIERLFTIIASDASSDDETSSDEDVYPTRSPSRLLEELLAREELDVPAAQAFNLGDDDEIDDPDFVDFSSLLGPKKRPTHRDAFEVIKATLLLTDSQSTKLLLIWVNLMPVEDWENLPTDGRSLARPKPEYLRQLKIRKVVCGLQKKDFVPFHKEQVRKRMLAQFAETGHTISLDAPNYKHRGDILDFDIEKSLLMESPGSLNPQLELRMLQQIHAARPNLLSSDFLKLVDERRWRTENADGNPLRSKMNLFALKFHSDGVQIAKNSVSSECTPLSCAIDSVYPYDPETRTYDAAAGLVIPSSMSSVHTVSLYHGRQACGPMEFGVHWKAELKRLHPNAVNPPPRRRLVIEQKMMIADAVERSKRAGMPS
jgi:hypothetical protein